MHRVKTDLDYVAHLARDSRRFAAADLDCWLWHRAPLPTPALSGDQEVLSGFESAIAPGID